MTEMKTAAQHNMELGVQPTQQATLCRPDLSELKDLALRDVIHKLVEQGYFASDVELNDLIQSKL